MNRRAIVVAIVATAFLLVVGLPVFVGLTADWYWYQAVGFQSVFLKSTGTEFAVGLGVGFGAFAFLFGNLRFAQRGVVPHPVLFAINPRTPSFDLIRVFRRLALPAALFLSFLFGVAGASSWLTVLRFLNRVPFGETDPVFHRDIGYYVFTLPALSALLGALSALTVISLVMIVPLYVMRGDILLRRRASIEPSAQVHLGALLALFLATAGANLFLVRIPSLLYSTTGDRFFGASYADLSTGLPLLRVLGVVALLGVPAVLLGALQRRLIGTALIAVGAYVVTSVLSNLAPAVVQRLIVLPNELAKETPQLRNHIAATRRAWGLDSVLVRDINGEAQLTLKDIRANQGTIENVRLWDRDPLLQTFGQLQEIRTYYDFVSVDDDRYWIDGKYRQVLLSPRELNTTSLPTRNFINDRLTFTHGMGITLSPVNQVTQEGLPVLFIKDLPPESNVSLKVKRPAIYYGELSSDYVFVNTGQPEFDYPSGESNTYTKYAGAGGVPVGSWLRRALLSVNFSSLKIMLSNDITNESQALYHRNIVERAARALPFLRWDNDPYMVVRDDGRLQWILDAYTLSDGYPYAQPLSDGTNYMRNSVKVVIDAYDGTIEPYVSAPNDPLIQSYARAFPGIFKPLDSMPADLRAHIRYPEDLFRAQSGLYATYHMDSADVFYHREDQWQFPATGEDARNTYLRHMVMRLPGEAKEEFIEMTPYTPRGKDNLAAWMVARNDGEHYGKLAVYRFPRQSLVFGPTQIQNRINQNTEISQQISLWDQRGSQVVRGNLLVIPIGESLIFVQALYLRAEGGRIPELKRVTVAYQNQVVMEETLERALARLFGGEPGGPAPATRQEAPVATGVVGGTAPQLANEAADHFDRAIAAQRVGDWATYGAEIAKVGELLRRIRSR